MSQGPHTNSNLLSVFLGLLVWVCPGYAATPIPADAQFSVSLDGAWRFKLEQENGKSKRPTAFTQKYPLEIPATFEPFYKTNYHENGSWHDLKVPGNWEMAGYSPATYYQPDNASGFYRERFVVPESWRGRLVKVNFDGVQNAAEIWLNGQPVPVTESSWGRTNYHESGWTAWQADLTPFVKFGQENLLALRVTKNSRSVDCDSGDYFFLGGVYRPVTLFSVPPTHIEDFLVSTHLLEDGRAEVKTRVVVAGASDHGKVSVHLEGEEAISGTADAQGQVELTQIVSHPRLWSAEFPNLYAMDLSLEDAAGSFRERVSRQVGIREVTIKHGLLLVNGRRVKLTGICRHDVSATEGTAVGEELWTKDLKLMKEANINAIRCSHYPYGSGFYDLCDKLGFYVLGELPYCWVGPPTMVTNCPGDDPALTPSFEQRARETVNRDKNHPSIIVWGIGNENYGKKPLLNLQRAADLARELDPTRPRLVSGCLAEKYHVEMDDCHYPTMKMEEEDIADKKRRAEYPKMYSEHPNVYDVRRGADYGALDLWTAVMTRTWALIWQCDSIPGSFLWEWQDRAVADKCKTKLYDFDPETGVSYVKNKGLVDGWRNPRPDLYAVKMVYSPIQVSREVDLLSKPNTACLLITNRYSFTDLSHLDAEWHLFRNGASLAEGASHLKLAPLTSGQVELPLPAPALRHGPDTLRVAFNDPRGWNVVTCQFELVKPKPLSIKGTPLPNGLLFPRLNLVGEVQTHDPNKHLSTERFPGELRNVRVEPAGCKSEALKDVKALEADLLLRSDPPEVVGHVRASFANGVFRYHIDWTGSDTWIQELGWVFEMPNAYNRFSWKREADWSYYPDTHIGRPEGTALPDSANAHVTKIERPDAFDFNSSKYHCDWASLTDARGRGLCVQLDSPEPYAVRGGFGKNGTYTLIVNRQASPPRENNIIPDFSLQLKKGDTVDGSFFVGSRK